MIKTPQSKELIFESSSSIITVREDGILHIHIKEELTWEIENSRKLFEERKKIANGKKYPILYTGTKFVIPSNAVRDFVVSQERNELVLADAYIHRSLPQKIIANFYARINKPIRPTRFFNNKEKAIAWLSTFVESDS